VEFLLLLLLAYLVPLVGIIALGWTPWAGLAFLSALPALRATVPVLRHRPGTTDPRDLIPPLGSIAQAAGLYGVLLGSGLALG